MTLTLTASHPGYETATGEIEVVVEDLLAGFDPELFDLEFWRQMVFDALICSPGSSEPTCAQHRGLPVWERTVQVYPGRPDFVIYHPCPGRGPGTGRRVQREPDRGDRGRHPGYLGTTHRTSLRADDPGQRHPRGTGGMDRRVGRQRRLWRSVL